MSARRLPRRRSAALLLAGSAAVLSGLLGQATPVSASSNAALQGALAVFPVAKALAPVQLFAGTDGRLWFVTARSQLGEISGAGQATLTGVTLPHGSTFGTATPATIAAAGTEGVWSVAATVNLPPSNTSGCVVTLVAAGGSVTHPTLPASLTDFSCTSAAADASGALWVGLVSGKYGSLCKCRIAIVAEITTAGQVTLFNPLRPGARPLAVALGGDGAIWVLEGSVTQQYGRYTASGSPSALSSPCCGWQGMLARPDGSFWLLRQIFCSGLTPPFCPKVEVSQPGGLSSRPFLYPVSAPNGGGLPMSLRTAVGPDGSLWMAGQQSSGPDRLFRMDANGQIDRSAALTTSGATALLADGPIAVTPAGTVWAVASAGSSTYLVRYVLGGSTDRLRGCHGTQASVESAQR